MSQEKGPGDSAEGEATPLKLSAQEVNTENTASGNVENSAGDGPGILSLSTDDASQISSTDYLKNGIVGMHVAETYIDHKRDTETTNILEATSGSRSTSELDLHKDQLASEDNEADHLMCQQLNGTQNGEDTSVKCESDLVISTEEEEAISSLPPASVKETDECCINQDDQEKIDEWMDILGNGNLKKKVVLGVKQGRYGSFILSLLAEINLRQNVLSKGRENSRPPQGSLVTVKVEGFLQSGSCFQNITETFILGDGDTLPAIDMTVALMDVGETAMVTTASRFAYGKHGREPDIPADADVTFNLELLDVQPGPDVDKLGASERLTYGEKKRERGNELFGHKDFSGAINSYSKAVKFLDAGGGSLDEEAAVLQQMLDCKLKCYNNMAASQLKIGAVDAAVRSLNEVLAAQPDNIKALYRLGKAYSTKGQIGEAVAILKKAIKLDPESKLLHRELSWLTKQQQREAEKEKSLYKRMIGGMSGSPKQPSKKPSGGVLKWTLLAGGLLAAGASALFAYYKFGH